MAFKRIDLTDPILREYLSGGELSPTKRGDGVFVGNRKVAPQELSQYGIILPKGGMIIPGATLNELQSSLSAAKKAAGDEFLQVLIKPLEKKYGAIDVPLFSRGSEFSIFGSPGVFSEVRYDKPGILVGEDGRDYHLSFSTMDDTPTVMSGVHLSARAEELWQRYLAVEPYRGEIFEEAVAAYKAANASCENVGYGSETAPYSHPPERWSTTLGRGWCLEWSPSGFAEYRAKLDTCVERARKKAAALLEEVSGSLGVERGEMWPSGEGYYITLLISGKASRRLSAGEIGYLTKMGRDVAEEAKVSCFSGIKEKLASGEYVIGEQDVDTYFSFFSDKKDGWHSYARVMHMYGVWPVGQKILRLEPDIRLTKEDYLLLKQQVDLVAESSRFKKALETKSPAEIEAAREAERVRAEAEAKVTATAERVLRLRPLFEALNLRRKALGMSTLRLEEEGYRERGHLGFGVSEYTDEGLAHFVAETDAHEAEVKAAVDRVVDEQQVTEATRLAAEAEDVAMRNRPASQAGLAALEATFSKKKKR